MRLGGLDLSLAGLSALSRSGGSPGVPDALPLDIIAVPSVGAPAVTSASGVQLLGLVAASTVGSPTVDEQGQGTATPVGIIAAPTVGIPAVSSVDGVTPSGIVAAPTVGTPAIASADGVAPLGLTSTPTVGAPTVTAPATNLITNGTFAAADANWTANMSWDETGGNASLSAVGTGSRLMQTLVGGELTPGNYNWGFDILDYSAGQIRFQVLPASGSTALVQGSVISSNGTHGGTITVPSGGTRIWLRVESGPFTGKIDNVSLTAA
jgi:hypothetical protein